MTENRKAMDRKLKAGTAVDVPKCPREDPWYILDEVIKDKDYFDGDKEV
jgi:hypothetical protein